MRRLLLALGLATIVGGATLGAAATLGLPDTTLSAGNAIVASCDTTPGNNQVIWHTGWNSDGFQITSVQIRGLDEACVDLPAVATLTFTGGDFRVTDPGGWWNSPTLDDNEVSFAFHGGPGQTVANLTDLHVMIGIFN